MEGEGSPSAKRMRLSATTSYPCGGKNRACIVFYCRVPSPNHSWEESRIECNICIVDLNSDHSIYTLEDDDADDNPVGGEVDPRLVKGFARVSPTFQIDCGFGDYPPNDAFCVLGEKLYVFEGSRGFGEDDSIKQSVFAIDLSESVTLTRETTKLEKGGPLMKKIGEMLSPKVYPVALATPDGKKIVVFPTWWYRDIREIEGGKMSHGGFEIFDPANPQSPLEPLPRLTHSYRLEIDRYGFIEGSDKLLVQISHGNTRADSEFCVLDLSVPDKEWSELDKFYKVLDFIPPMHDLPSFFETAGERRFWFVNRHGFFDLEDCLYGSLVFDDDLFEFRVPGGDEEFLFGRVRGFCSIDVDSYVARCLTEEDDEDMIHFCRMLMERPSNLDSCRVVVAVYSVDLRRYKEHNTRSGSHQLEVTKLVRKHKFLLGFEGERDLEQPAHLFFTF